MIVKDATDAHVHYLLKGYTMPQQPVIEIYTTAVCPYCVRAKQLLQQKGMTYTEIDATDGEVRARMMDKAGGRKTVPQIFIGGQHIGGCDDLYALDGAGKLDALLRGGD